MKLEYLAIAIVALAAATCAGPTHSPPASENRYRRTGNGAGRATDSKRENTAAATTNASKNVPISNGEAVDRKRKAIAPWDLEHTEFQSHTFASMSVWKPPVYSLSRPYFIPIYGSSGRIPIYFAPQPLGDYDKTPFVGPAYLPPKEYPTEEPVTVKNRFEFDDDDDRPVWDKGNTNDINDKDSDKTVNPPGSIHLSADDENIMNEIFKMRPAETTRKPLRPRPTPRPTPTTTTTTTRPSTVGPSNCVWAVVSCCSANTNVYPEKCFEQRGCPGPFWGSSPCDTEFAKAAVEAALKYYNP